MDKLELRTMSKSVQLQSPEQGTKKTAINDQTESPRPNFGGYLTLAQVTKKKKLDLAASSNSLAKEMTLTPERNLFLMLPNLTVLPKKIRAKTSIKKLVIKEVPLTMRANERPYRLGGKA